MLSLLSNLAPLAKTVGRVTGVLGKSEIGIPIKGRKTRLVASVTALLVALGAWAGLPEPVAAALADVAVELGLMAVE